MLFFRFINTIPIQAPALSFSFPEVAPVMSKAAPVFTIPPPQPASSEDEYDGLPADGQFSTEFCGVLWDSVSRLERFSSLLSVPELRNSSVVKRADIAFKALKGRLKTVASIKSALNHVNGFISFFWDNSLDDTASLTGEGSVLALHDYFESLHARGQSVPRTARSALSVFRDALGINWPLDHPLVASVIVVDDPNPPKQAPSFTLDLLRRFDSIACDQMVTSGKRLFASAIILMTLTSLRFADVQRLKSLVSDKSSIHGTLLTSKTKRPHGLDWPFACPKIGFCGNEDWFLPILQFRTAHEKVNGAPPSFLIPKLSFGWEVEKAEAISYSSARRKLTLLCVAAGHTDCEQYTLHTPKNFLPSCANEMSFSKEDKNVIGHWQSGSKMSERYDRSTCAQELLLRNTIVANINGGWSPVGPFSIPSIPPSSVGKTALVGCCVPECTEPGVSAPVPVDCSFPPPSSLDSRVEFLSDEE